jgi:hypothetical protein
LVQLWSLLQSFTQRRAAVCVCVLTTATFTLRGEQTGRMLTELAAHEGPAVVAPNEPKIEQAPRRRTLLVDPRVAPMTVLLQRQRTRLVVPRAAASDDLRDVLLREHLASCKALVSGPERVLAAARALA